ncbi:hypothetical protein [Nostoc sp.]|uniref:hypothetical protein n=1 Tax=Nostoc sp. TaxID=1180 RepID=UPI002FF78022
MSTTGYAYVQSPKAKGEIVTSSASMRSLLLLRYKYLYFVVITMPSFTGDR